MIRTRDLLSVNNTCLDGTLPTSCPTVTFAFMLKISNRHGTCLCKSWENHFSGLSFVETEVQTVTNGLLHWQLQY